MRVIKRYSNRKLYDTVGKRYITLEHIEELVKKGEEVRIIDNESKEDITAVTLSNIIYEKAKDGTPFTPSFFTKLIRTGSSSMYDYLKKTLQGISSAAYFVESEVKKNIKGLVSSGEITEEEGKKIERDITKKSSLPHGFESFIDNVMQSTIARLQIPSKKETEHLTRVLERLEKQIERMEREEHKKK